VYVAIAVICMKIERSRPVYHTVMLLLCILSAASWMVGKTPAPQHMATEKTVGSPYSEVGHISCKNGLCSRKRNLCYPVCEAKLSDTYSMRILSQKQKVQT